MFCAVTEEAQLEGLRTGTIVVDSRGNIHQRLLSGWWKERTTGTTSTPEVEYPALIIAYGQDIIRELEKLRESKQAMQYPVLYDMNEIDKLPVGSVVLDDDGDAWQKTYTDHWSCTDDLGRDISVYRPVRVLYRGEEIEQ